MTPRYPRFWFPVAVFALLALASPAQASFFDITYRIDCPAPPYPTAPPVSFAVLDDLGAGLVPLQTMSLGLKGAGVSGEATYSTVCRGSDGDPAPEYIGPTSFFDVFLESATPLPPPEQRVQSFFDIFTEISIYSTGLPGQLVTVNDAYPIGDPRRYIDVQYFAPDSFFDVFLEVALPEEPGSVIRYGARYSLSDAALAAGGQLAGDPVVNWRGVPDSFFDVFLEISLPGSLPAGTKALSVTTTAARVTSPVSSSQTTWGALKSLYR